MFDRDRAILQSFLWLCHSLWSCSFHLSIFVPYDNVRWEMNIYDAHPQGQESPRGKPPRTKFTAFSPPHSLRIKLQIYSTAAPCLRVHLGVLHEWELANVQHRRSCTFRTRKCTRPESVYLPREPICACWILRLISNLGLRFWEPPPESGWSLSAQGFRHQTGSYRETRTNEIRATVERDYLVVRKLLINRDICVNWRVLIDFIESNNKPKWLHNCAITFSTKEVM